MGEPMTDEQEDMAASMCVDIATHDNAVLVTWNDSGPLRVTGFVMDENRSLQDALRLVLEACEEKPEGITLQ